MKNLIIKTIVLLTLSPACQAHVGEQSINGLWQGVLHPLTGLDHLFTLVAIGMLATRNNQAEKLLLPAVFLVSMVFGFVFSMSDLSLGVVEKVIAVSVIILGIWLISGKQLNGALLLVMVSGVAIAHGYAHGTEVVGATMYYLSGVISSAFLLMIITLLAFRYASPAKNKIQSFFGAIIVALGFVYLLQV